MSPPHRRLAALTVAALLLSFALLAVAADEKEAKPAAPAAAAAAPAAAPANANPDAEEPPLEFELEVGGRKTEVLLDRETTIDMPDGKRVKARLTARPERLFRAGGVSFRYPRHHAFEFERDADVGLSTWTFDGNDNVLILTRYDNPIDEDDLRQSVVEGITSQFAGADHKTENTTLSLGGLKRPAVRIRVKVAGTALVQDVCTWKAEGKNAGSYSLIVQDSPPEDGAGKPSADTARMLKLLDETFKQDEAK